MLNVPSVAMNGGSPIRVTSSPLSRPHKVPKATPNSRASKAGTPLLTARLDITSMDKMEMAPTERSIPAVSTINV